MQTALEYRQGRRLRNRSGKSVQVCGYPQSEVLPHIQVELSVRHPVPSIAIREQLKIPGRINSVNKFLIVPENLG